MRKYGLILIVFGFLVLELVVNGMGLNGPHMDESIFFLGGQDVLAGNIQQGGYMVWFAGSPYWWPVVSSLGFTYLGGVFGARLMATLATTLALYFFGRFALNITRNESAGLWATGMFAVFGPLLHLAHFTTYDQAALFGITLSLWILTEYHKRQKSWILIVAGLAFAVGVLGKYPMLLMIIPTIGLIYLQAQFKEKNWRYTMMDILMFVICVAIPLLAYLAAFWNAGLDKWWEWGNTHRNSFGATHLSMAIGIFWYALIPLILGLLAVIIERRSWRYGLIALVAFAIWPTYHIVFLNGSADQKHIVFSAMFIFPLIGQMLSRWTTRRLGQVLAAGVFVISAGYGLVQMWRLDHSWLDARGPAEYIAAISQPGDQILIADAWSSLPSLMKAGKLANRYDVADLWTVDNIQDYHPCMTTKFFVYVPDSTYNFTHDFVDGLKQCGFVKVQTIPGYITPGNQWVGYEQDTEVYINTHLVQMPVSSP